ncbi:MAG: hypothetical protein PHQ00_07745 [Phycisphaerae bacterium]|nr:hypothetical protein [Phycisphaerae bacterium]
MKTNPSKMIWLTRWHLFFAVLAAVAIASLLVASAVPAVKIISVVLLLLAAAAGIFIIIFLLNHLVEITSAHQQKLEQINELLSANKELLEQTADTTRLSDAAKSVLYRDTDIQQLSAAVMQKLHQQDLKATYTMIENIARKTDYHALAEELEMFADSYRDATEQERVNQIAAYIEKLLDQRQWTTAAAYIENFIKKFPDSEKALSFRQKLTDKKEQRKRQLFAEWDSAVKRQDTDKSLAVLKELDFYLTPSEGLALQESASEVFKNKLHTLGVRFALCVSEKRWADAITTGKEIIKGFPNSRMADEIRGKMSILRELSQK